MKAYIDESGDTGIGRGTRWLVFGLAMLNDRDVASAEAILRKTHSRIFGENKKPGFHFCEMGHPRKIAALDGFVAAPWIGCLLARDTTEAHSLPYDSSPSRALYKLMLGYLLEVVSRRAEHLQEEATIYIEEGTVLPTSLPSFLEYFGREARDGVLRINDRWISKHRIHVIGKKEHLLLALADGVAHAGHSALEPNRISRRREKDYYGVIIQKLWGRDPLDGVNVYDHGLLFRPKRRLPDFIQEYPWLVLSEEHEK